MHEKFRPNINSLRTSNSYRMHISSIMPILSVSKRNYELLRTYLEVLLTVRNQTPFLRNLTPCNLVHRHKCSLITHCTLFKEEKKNLVRVYQTTRHHTSDNNINNKTWSNINLSKPKTYIMYHQFNIHKFYVLPTQCIYVFCVDLRTNSVYFSIQY